MVKQTKQCKSCRYWFQIKSKLGECRRPAPVLVMSVTTETSEIANKAIWPRVFDTEWCGDFDCLPDIPEQEPQP